MNYDYDTEEGYACPKCLDDLFWEDCTQCTDGYSYHDCGDDTCCCLYPEDNVACDMCGGCNGWWMCISTTKCGSWTTPELHDAWKEREAT